MEEVTAREQRSQHNTQRDDLPSRYVSFLRSRVCGVESDLRDAYVRNDNDVSGIHGSAVVDLPRAGHSTSLGSSGPRRQLQPIAGNYHYSLPSHTPSDATSVLEEAQGNSLYDRMDDFHFSPQLSERRALVTASFDIACSKTAHNAHPVGDASSFRNPSAGEYPAAAYPTFIPGHEHVGPSDQAWRGGARTQEVVHSTSTLSGITSDLPYGFDDCHVYTDDGASSSYDPSSFAGGFMQTSPPMRRTGQSTTSPSRRPQAPTRSVYDVDVHTLSRKSDCGYDTSPLSGTMATAVESDASGQSQAPSFAHCQYQSQPPHLPQHLPPRNSSDLSYAYIPAPSSQPLRSDADYSPVPNPGSESDSSPVSALGRSVTGLTTCSSATHLQPHSAPPVLHERSCSPFYGDSHSPARQLNVALPLSSLGRSPQSSFRRGLPRGFGYERDFSASAYMDELEMRPEGWGTTLFRQPAGLSQIASSARPDPDFCGSAYKMPMSVQPSPSSVGVKPASPHIRRWSSVSVGSTPTSRFPTALQATSQSYTTRLRRHSQVVSSAPSLRTTFSISMGLRVARRPLVVFGAIVPNRT
ncbi:hypothetical protein PISMIDRAFT_9330 [Pisolithus microcarpus 441]|uniref:Uncharacterized protein n=1 Tax=Pisolithus microcarpus 441 TaxID=765257 RepID=A0A0D0A124_9AGAM|nr:hypothetical protein PISMIDRAFT_9330 [Pisolithus microcarpus 441]